MSLIRPAEARDIAAITAIYAHHVRHSTGTFATEPPTEAEMAALHAEVRARGLPWLVACASGADDARVLGFAYCNWFRPRGAFRFSAEDTIYLAPDMRGQGLGRALMAELMARAQAAGVRRLMAVVGDRDNAASIGLHRACGYQQAGQLRECGWKFDRWLDLVLMDRPLGAGAGAPPVERPVERLVATSVAPAP